MATSVHISEADAARDFAAVMARVRAGDEVVVEGADGAVAVMRSAEADRVQGERSMDVRRIPGKTAAEIVAGLRRWEAEKGPLLMDADFADDLEEAQRWANQPLDDSKWD